jgi:hypothetical protein
MSLMNILLQRIRGSHVKTVESYHTVRVNGCDYRKGV